jgi:hypothetical protein
LNVNLNLKFLDLMKKEQMKPEFLKVKIKCKVVYVPKFSD